MFVIIAALSMREWSEEENQEKAWNVLVRMFVFEAITSTPGRECCSSKWSGVRMVLIGSKWHYVIVIYFN